MAGFNIVAGPGANIVGATALFGASGTQFAVGTNGEVAYSGPSATSASAGSNGAAPLMVGGYITATISGTTVKIPYYLN